jgi:hypothetical protein
MKNDEDQLKDVQREMAKDMDVEHSCDDLEDEFEREAEWQRLMEEDNSVCNAKVDKSLCRLERALQNLDVDSYDFELQAKRLNELLVGYSLFWGTNADGEPYIEWYNSNNHSITLTYF